MEKKWDTVTPADFSTLCKWEIYVPLVTKGLISSTALNKQQFLNPFTITSGETLCHAVVIHTD
jgi:hypothetical protein